MFELNQQCLIEHVNLRRGKNEDSPVALDIKLSTDVLPTECAAAALAARGPGEVQQAFFADSKPRFVGMDVLPIDRDWEGKHMVTIDGLEGMRVTRLFNIRLLPLVSGHFASTFTVSIEQPSAAFLDAISKRQHKSVGVSLVQDVRELELAKKKDKTADQQPGKVKKTKGEEQAALIN